jgi:Zn-dependent membrane protease YugP
LLLSFPLLIDLGIVFFGVSVLFYVITLLVEFSASARAIALLRENHVLNEEELNGVKKSMCVYFTNEPPQGKPCGIFNLHVLF